MTAAPDAFCIVAFATLGQAQRSRRLLLDRGTFAELIRTPRRLNLIGCGFSLRLPVCRLGDLCNATRQAGIETRGRFVETASGYEAVA